ncbi:MAG: hypothetical protein K0A89_10030, partial [ANME-2 cluster archaeon]|nr:hypothetical protein [ANME-2 cluster archaeon]
IRQKIKDYLILAGISAFICGLINLIKNIFLLSWRHSTGTTSEFNYPTPTSSAQPPHPGTSAGGGQESEPEWTPDLAYPLSGPGHHESREWLPPPSEGSTGPGVERAMVGAG